MAKRLLSLLLSVVMVAGLFAGLAVPVSANDEIGRLFDRYLTGERIEELFEEDNVVQTGSCGKDGQANVMYKIYLVDSSKIQELNADTSLIEQNTLYQKLREKYPDLKVDGQNLLTYLNFDLDPDNDYYAVKIYGAGEMENYSLNKRAPWSGTIQLADGSYVDLEEQLVAAYVEGKSKTVASATGVTSVGDYAFFGQDMLMMCYLGEKVEKLGVSAFETCDKLSAVNFPSALKQLGKRAFFACDYLTFARMNDCQFTEIPDYCFCSCSHLTSVWMPNRVTSIGKLAFAWDHVLGTEQFNLPSSLKTIGEGAFLFCTHLGAINEIVIPLNTTVIGDWAFALNFAMSDLVINHASDPANDVRLTINRGAFVGCSSLQEINFPNRVAQIGNYAFAACDKLVRVSFGDKNGTEFLHTSTIGDRSFDSLADTALSVLRVITGGYADGLSDVTGYVLTVPEKLRGEVENLSGVTPLQEAAFGSIPPAEAAIVAATENMNSFPTDVMIYYPSQEYNAAAYTQWRAHSGMNRAGDKWCGYNCQPVWVGHFHTYAEEPDDIIERTCTQDGEEIYYCHHWEGTAECRHEKRVVTAEKTGHESEVIEIVNPTCTEDGFRVCHCSNEWCDKPDYIEKLPATGHDLEHLQNGTYQAPTCLKSGYARGTCPKCGEYIETTIPPKGHDLSIVDKDQSKEPTCTEEGLYFVEYCRDCGRRNVRQTVPALGHDWGEGTVIRPATDSTDGLARYYCSRCGVTKDEAIPKKIHTHQYESKVVPPTCTEEGYTRYTCKLCGIWYDDDFVDPAHSWDNGKITTQPGPTTEGVKTFTCKVCGETRTEKIPPTGGGSACDGGRNCPSRVFRDVDRSKDSWYHLPVDWAVTNDITQGVDDDLFGPFENCTRGQAVTFLWRAAGKPAVENVRNRFVDVTKDDYFYEAVLWAVKNGITDGTSDYTFSPYDTCTRGHIVTFLYRFEGKPIVRQQNIPFIDVLPGMWYSLPVLWAVEKQITDGTSETTFSPDDSCTRAHIVTFLYRDKAEK